MTTTSQAPSRFKLGADAPIRELRRVGPQLAKRLAKIGIQSIQDLLFHLPLRYEDRTRIVPIGDLHVGDGITVQGEVIDCRIQFSRRRMLLVAINDGSGILTLRFFNFNSRQQASLLPGITLRCYGEVRLGRGGLEMMHPEYRSVLANAEVPVNEHLTPIYPTTEGLGQASLRMLVEQCFDRDQQLRVSLTEYLPAELLQEQHLPSLREAVSFVHRPTPDSAQSLLAEGIHPAQQRLAFEELLAHYLSLRQLREQHSTHRAPVLAGDGQLRNALRQALPFQLTGAQQRVLTEIEADLIKSHPMQRLVQGDVGSGKTIVAALAALQAIEAGYQVAVMAPTEILAEQHLHSFRQWMEPFGIEPVWLAGKVKGKKREQVLAAINSAEAKLIIGTQALFQEGVSFNALALVIIDEQHRFGVHQRLALRNKGSQGELYPHQLIMTATPIPRTLTMVAYADVDCSVIDELPPNRKPVETVVMGDERREELVQRVYKACREGQQAYWVCTLIEESELLQCQAAENTAAELAQQLNGIRVGLIHGRMKADEKNTVMTRFKRGDLDLLVATTVIEVGVDVPNASLMIIENAERLGLSQLHQLRGRVGRGTRQSVCVLLYHPPLSQLARKRLQVLRESNDGFVVAGEDLELRGPGEMLGTRQAGVAQMHIADLSRDQGLLQQVQICGQQLLKYHPQQVPPIIRRWLGDKTHYSAV